MTTIVPGDATQQAFISSAFSVDFPAVAGGLFTEASGLSMDIEEVESTRITDKGLTVTRFSPGTVKYGTVTLKREFNGDRRFYAWHQEMCQGKGKWADGSIILYDLAGTEVDRWNVMKAWPSKWSVSDLDASGDDPITEEIELQLEFLERAK